MRAFFLHSFIYNFLRRVFCAAANFFLKFSSAFSPKILLQFFNLLRRAPWFAAPLLFAAAALSCSGANPVIYTFKTAVQVVGSPARPDAAVEQLLLQLLAGDDDGFNELYEVYVIHDESQLYWRITSDQWNTFTVGSEQWITIRPLKSYGGRPLPRGAYRLVLRDLSGYEDEKTFTLDVSYKLSDIPSLAARPDGRYAVTLGAGSAAGSSSGSASGTQTQYGLLQLLYAPAAPVAVSGAVAAGAVSGSTASGGSASTPPPAAQNSVAGAQNNAAGAPQDQVSPDEQAMRSLLGASGTLYRIAQGQPLAFYAPQNVRFEAYVHYFSNDGLVLSRGPYTIALKAQ